MVRYDAFADRDWQDQGVARVAVTRTRDNGWIEAGVFLVDLWCLGVKDAFAAEMPAVDWPHELARMFPVENRVPLHPACARKLVEGAVAYAQALGFAPHRDYKKARRVFGSVDARDCPQTFTFGKDGKPLYVAGPHDDQQRIDRVLRALEARLGAGGFHYIVPENPDVLAEMAREELLTLFRERPEGEAGFAAADGFFAATHACPTAIESSEIIAAFWGDTPPQSRNEEEARQFDRLLFNYWDEVGQRLDLARQDDDPTAFVDFGDDPADAPERRNRARAWCRGFLRVVKEWPEEWVGAPDRPELRPHFDAIRAAADSAIAPTTTPEELSLHLGGAVRALYGALRPQFADDEPVAEG